MKKKMDMRKKDKPKVDVITRLFAGVAIFCLLVAAYYFAKAWLAR
jgi:hypothetical protein